MRLKRILVSLCFLALTWTLFLFGRFFLIDKPIENLTHLPENTIFAMRLDGSSALKSTLFSVLLEANDPEVIEVINQQINKKWKQKGVSKSLGIDYLSDIVVYVFPFEGEKMLGFTYNLSKPELMRKNANLALDSTQCYAINDHIGVVLKYLGKQPFTREKRNRAIEMAKQIALHPIKSEQAEKIAKKETNKFLELTSQGMLFGSSTLFTRTDMDLILKDHSLLLEGQMIKNRREKRVFTNENYTLRPSGMHFYTTLIPEKAQDSLANLCTVLNLKIPKIEAIALNYRGLRLNNPDGILLYTPDFDLVLNFQTPVDLATELKKSEFLNELKMTFKNQTTLTNGIKDFFLTKMNARTYLISTLKNAKVKKNNPSSLLSIEGSLNHFTNVTGDKWIMLFLNNFPFYYNSQNFFSKTDGIKISVTNTDDFKAKLEGKLQFKNEFFPMNEFFKYGVQNNLIRLK